MTVGIAAPLSIAAVTGGVKTQVFQTVHHLRELGVEVEFINLEQTRFDYDLVHVFTASPETLGIAKQVHEKGLPLVVSPVFFSNQGARVIRLSLFVERLLSKLGSGIGSEFGIKAQICQWANMVLPNTKQELELIRDGFGIPEHQLRVIPNGVESRFSLASPDLFMETYFKKDFVLFVGQAGAPRKNLKLLLEAAPRIQAQIVVIGNFYDNEYSRECLRLVNNTDNVLLIETQAHDAPLLASAYAACKVFVLPSFFETPGIAAMEAALAGAEIVITNRGGTQEYFGAFAEYIAPTSVEELVHAIHKKLQSTSSDVLKKHILANYTWDKVAQQTLQVYHSLS